jgi:hypothetical protein
MYIEFRYFIIQVILHSPRIHLSTIILHKVKTCNMLQFIAAQQRNAAVPILAGVSLLGAGIYYTTKKHPEVSATQDRHEKLQSKLDEGLGAAGIGGNATTGGHDYGQNQDRVQGTTAPKEDLPSGGVGGGVGEEVLILELSRCRQRSVLAHLVLEV